MLTVGNEGFSSGPPEPRGPSAYYSGLTAIPISNGFVELADLLSFFFFSKF